MAKLNYSRQREAILDFLCHTTSHPTAEEVYMYIRDIYPNISLGTVYRNLALLVEHGQALKIKGRTVTILTAIPGCTIIFCATHAIMCTMLKWNLLPSY